MQILTIPVGIFKHSAKFLYNSHRLWKTNGFQQFYYTRFSSEVPGFYNKEFICLDVFTAAPHALLCSMTRSMQPTGACKKLAGALKFGDSIEAKLSNKLASL